MGNSKDTGFNETAIRIAFENLNAIVQAKNVDNIIEIQEFERAMNRHNYTIQRMLRELMQPCNRMLRYCSWLDTVYRCDELFIISRTAKGFCCSFNYKGPLRY